MDAAPRPHKGSVAGHGAPWSQALGPHILASMHRSPAAWLTGAFLLAAASACSQPASKTPTPVDTLDVMNAASITQPMHALLDSFAARTGTHYTLQPGASLELARLIAETGRRPDVLLSADPAIFPKLLEPRFVNGYEIIARNRIVLAYTAQSRGASEITPDNWRTVITRPGVQVGRADPNTDPSGYRTLLVMQLAERSYHDPGLYARLLAAAPARNVRPREADQVALLQTHDLDYIWTYQNLAEDNGLEFVKLPDAVDLGSPADSATYAAATVRVLGKQPGDTLTIHGAPILFGAAALTTAPHPALARQFMDFLTSPDGRRIARSRHFEVLDSAIVIPRR